MNLMKRIKRNVGKPFIKEIEEKEGCQKSWC